MLGAAIQYLGSLVSVLRLGKNLHIDPTEIAAISAPYAVAFTLYTRGGAVIEFECANAEDANRVHAQAVEAMQSRDVGDTDSARQNHRHRVSRSIVLQDDRAVTLLHAVKHDA